MKKCKVTIFTEGSGETGFGHLARCSALWNAFDNIGIQPHFIVNGDEAVKDFLKGMDCTLIHWLSLTPEIKSIILQSDIVVVDSYLAEIGFYQFISDHVSVPLFFDDDRRLSYPRGIVLNAAVKASSLNYPAQDSLIYLLDTSYLALRKEFCGPISKLTRDHIESVLITFGGDDSRDLTSKVLQELNHCFPKLIKNVVIGKGFPFARNIERAKDSCTVLHYFPCAKKMKQLMSESDIAIASGGQTLYELAAVGVPVITIQVSRNQDQNIAGWSEIGFIEHAGWWEDPDVYKKAVGKIQSLSDKALREFKVSLGSRYVDGRGASRVVSKCLYEYNKDKIIVRKATLKDLKGTFDLSNDPDVRESSFDSRLIQSVEHQLWFEKQLNDENCFFIVLELQEKMVGQIRLNVKGSNADISISMSSKLRGLGLGQLFFRNTLEMFSQEFPLVKTVTAYVKMKNQNSARFFRKIGFDLVKELTIQDSPAFQFGCVISDKVSKDGVK